jgi:hypothetical protein
MQSQPATTDLSGLYDGDFFEWTRRNAELLRAGQVRQSDIQHIAEAIEDLGKQDLKELHRRARALLAHLLVGQLQPAKHAHWRLAPVTEERIWLDGLLEQSPSLKMILGNELPVYYAGAVRLAMAMARTAPGREQFPIECPFTVDQILDPDFLPRVQ